MTTSDDEPRFAPQDDPATTTHADPLADVPDDAGPATAPVAVARPSAGRLLLGILAALAVAAAGVAIWAVIYAQLEREYVGVSVAIGLLVGWVLRVVSGRSSIPIRVVAVLVTAVACVLGTVAGEVAYTAATFDADFWTLFTDVVDNWLDLFNRRPALTKAIFAAALVLAFLAASPQKEKPKKGAAAPAPVVPPAEEYEPGIDDPRDDVPPRDDDEDRPPATPAG